MSPSKYTARASQRRSTTALLKTPRHKPQDVHARDRASNPKRGTLQQQHNTNDSTITVLDFDIPVRSISVSPASKRKRQRHSTGNQVTPTKRPRRDHVGTRARRPEDEAETVHIFPLRQVLDGRIRRRIRRNGLSEEMNAIYSEKRTSRRKTEQELQRLRDEMARKDAELERLRGLDSSTTVFGSEGRDASHAQEMDKRAGQHEGELDHDSSADLDAHYDDSGIGMSSGLWDHDSDNGEMMDVVVDDDEFGNTTAEYLQCNTTPQQSAKTWSSHTSSPRISGPALVSPPNTSPARLSTPTTERQERPHIYSKNIMTIVKIATCDAALQVSIPDPEKETLEQELNTLRSEVAGLKQTLQAQEADMMEMLSEDQRDSDDLDLGLQQDIVMQDLSDKTTRLDELQSSLSSLLSLPLANNEEDYTGQTTMLRRLTETLRSMRLEFQYLSPGEILPDGADEVLDLAVQRLRDMDREIREKDGALQERDAMIQHQDEIIKDGDRQIDERYATIRERDATIMEKDTSIQEKDSRILSLELDVQRLNRTIADLEALARLLGDNEAALRCHLTTEREAASRKEETLADTEAKLAEVLAQAAGLRAQLAERDMQVIQRDARAAGLRAEVERLEGALAGARGQLRCARGDAVRDRVAAQNAVVAMRGQLLQALSVGEGFLSGVAAEMGSGPGSGSLSAASSFSSVAPKEEGRPVAGEGEGCDDDGEGKGVGDLVALPAAPAELFATKGSGKGKFDGGVGLLD